MNFEMFTVSFIRKTGNAYCRASGWTDPSALHATCAPAFHVQLGRVRFGPKVLLTGPKNGLNELHFWPKVS